jgi:RNA polymerase sigma factor (sigma-70 family)
LAFLKKISSAEPDPVLVASYRDGGDPAVLAELYQRYMDLVYGVCLQYLKEPEDAKDAVISIYEELVTKLRKHEVSHFRAWLFQVARNHCLMKLRSSKGKLVNLPDELMHSGENMHPDDALEKEANLVHLQDCISQLAKEQQKAISLFYLEERSYQEIAGLTGLDQGKVRSHIQNGRRNLKICMEKKAMEHTS